MLRPTALLAAAVLAMLPSACAVDASTPSDAPSEQTAQAVSGLSSYVTFRGAIYRNSIPLGSGMLELNGNYFLATDLVSRGLNGQSLDGRVLDERYVTGISLDGISVHGHTLQRQALAGTVFVNARAHGFGTFGSPLVGATFDATLDDGRPLRVRIDDAVRTSDPRFRDVMRYTVSYEASDTWRPFCGNAADGTPIRAIPLAGRWNYTIGVGGGAHVADDAAFTFACEGKILAECVTMGYKPWVSGQLCSGKGKNQSCSPVSIADYHQACTRMLRADYCGDGVTHTVDGVVISAFDGLGIRVDTEHYPFEAEWTTEGARCAVRQRVPQALPPCWQSLQKPDCGDPAHWSDGTLVMSEVQGAQ